MSSKARLDTVYIDALALVPKNKSGVGMTIHNTLVNLTAIIEPHMRICLVVPLGKANYLQQYVGPKVTIKTIPLHARVMEVLLRARLMPPIDWFMGTGVYIFPNYRNWPLWRSRSLTYIYDISFKLFPETMNVKNRRYLQRYMRRWINRTDKIVTISEQVRNEIEKYIGIEAYRITVVPCGVDAQLFRHYPATEIKQVKVACHIPYAKYMLFVGNIEPRKNLQTLLRAYELLPSKVQAAYGLVIVGGDGWLNQETFKKIENMQKHGLHVMKVEKFVSNEELAAIYSGASLLVHPALYEGFGMTPLEAMACETPVIVTDTPAIREVVGDAGLYSDPYQPSSVARIIQEGLLEPRSKRRAIAAERVRLFSWQRSAESLLQAVLEQQKAGSRKAVIFLMAKRLYQTFDRNFRDLLGERTLGIYKPIMPDDPRKAYAMLVEDYLKEQPNGLQVVGLKAYVSIRGFIARPLKAVVKTVRHRR